MNIVNGKEREVVELLRGYGLCNYEAKAYFALLAAGESKAGEVARKAGVPQSKVYDVLGQLASKGFVKQAENEKPAMYKAYALKETTEKVVALRARSSLGGTLALGHEVTSQQVCEYPCINLIRLDPGGGYGSGL